MPLFSYTCVHVYIHTHAHMWLLYTCVHIFLPLPLYLHRCLDLCLYSEGRENGRIPSKVGVALFLGKCWAFLQLTLRSHGLTCGVLGTRGAEMSQTQFLPCSGASSELETISMLSISLVDVFNKWKHWERRMSRMTKPPEASLGTSTVNMLCLVRGTIEPDIEQVRCWVRSVR